MKLFKKIRDNVLDSFNTEKGGYSARKLTAFATVLCIIFIHVKYIETPNAIDALFYDMLFVLLMLGIVTFEQLYRFKTGKAETPAKPTETTPTVTSGTTQTNTVVSDGPPADMQGGN
jgi:hypothetical protein